MTLKATKSADQKSMSAANTEGVKNWLIGIDPDTEKSGIATWDRKTQTFVAIQCLCFFDLIEYIRANKDDIKKVFIEGGWLNKGNRHLVQTRNGKRYTLNIYEAAEAGKDLGRNMQTGKLIGEMMQGLNIPYEVVKPLLYNTWKKDAAKFKQLTGYVGQTNPEKRDAGMLVYKK